MNDTIRTEPAEIQGGPLDGTRLSVVTGKTHFQVGKQIINDPDVGAVWAAGIHEGECFRRTGRRTASGRAIFVPATPESIPA